MNDEKDSIDFRLLLQGAYLQLKVARAKLESVEAAKREPIAVIGMGCRFPGGADSPEKFARLLRDKVDAITEVPASRWHVADFYDSNVETPGKAYVRSGGFLDQVDSFDAAFFGISPREAARMDPQHRLVLEVAREALDDGGQVVERLSGTQTGVFIGICNSDYSQLQFSNIEQINAYSGTGTSLSVVAGRISYLLDLHGPSLAVDTACSSSLVALHLACRSLRDRECDMALAGGVSLILIPHSFIMASKMRLLAADGRCKAFDAKADGTVGGEGCGVVVLKRLSDALRDNDNVLALIKGSAVNQDGRSAGLTAPNGLSQQNVVLQAFANAGIDASQVTYVEAHGTGTTLGDPIEVEALAAVFNESRAKRSGPCHIGSVKANIGHLAAAAGISGLIKVILFLRRGEIPPQLHLTKLNPNITLEATPFVIPTEVVPWPAQSTPRLAGVSSFGWAGTNCHVVVEEAPRPPASADERGRPDSSRCYCLPLSARSREALQELVISYVNFLTDEETAERVSVRNLCFTAGARRSHHEFRMSVVVSSLEQLVDDLRAFLRGEARPNVSTVNKSTLAPRVAFVYAGQGAVAGGLARRLLASEPVFRDAFLDCDRLIRELTGISIADELSCPPTQSRLHPDRTDLTQAAMLATQLGFTALWRAWGVEPQAVVGHSAGEVAAAATAGALSVGDAVRIMCERGRVMQEVLGAAAPGAMVAVRMRLAEAEAEVTRAGGTIGVAAHNAVGAVVLSGERTALVALVSQLRSRGIAYRWLDVNYAFHGGQVEGVCAELALRLDGLSPRPSGVPFYSAVDGRLLRGEQLGADYWARHVRQTVLFAEAVAAMIDDGYDCFVEICGSTQLTASVWRALRRGAGRGGLAVPAARGGQDEIGEGGDVRGRAAGDGLGALGEVWVHGVDVKWETVSNGGRVTRLPAYPWQRQRFWFENGNAAYRLNAENGYEGARCKNHLLISHTTLANPTGSHLCESIVSTRQLPYLRDHRVDGVTILPGAVYLEIVMAAAFESFDVEHKTFRLVEFQRALFLTDEGTSRLQIILSSEVGGGKSFQVYSWTDGPSKSGRAWNLNASGTIISEPIEKAEPGVRRAHIDGIRARCSDEISGESFYKMMWERGNQWGPSFQGIERIFAGRGEALGQIKAPAELKPAEPRYYIHPAMIDSCIQVLAAASPRDTAGGREGAYVGRGADEVRLHRRVQREELWAHAALRDVNGGSLGLVGDIRVYDAAGHPVLEILGVRLQNIEGPTHVGAKDEIANWLYEVDWREDPRRNDACPTQPQTTAEGKPVAAPPSIGVSGIGVEGSTMETEPHPAKGKGEWVLFADAGNIGRRLAQLLTARGTGCVVVSRGEIYRRDGASHFWLDPADPEHFKRLTAELFGPGLPPPLGFLHLWSLDAPPTAELTAASLEEAGVAGCVSTLHLVQALIEGQIVGPPPRLWVLTRGGQPAGVVQGPLSLAQVPIYGLCRTISHEFPELRCTSIDLGPECSRLELESLCEELLTDGNDTEVALRQHNRYVPRLRRRSLASVDSDGVTKLRGDSSYLITGGLGGVGLILAHWMVKKGVRHLILLGRSSPAPAALDAIEEMRQSGAEVHYGKTDVSDAVQLTAVLDDVLRTMPPLRGIFHAAAQLDDGVLPNLTRERFQSVLAAKAGGSWNLHRITEGQPLDFFVLFSSAASQLGSPGQANYAAANTFLDGLARERRRRGLPGMSINWGPWAEVGMAVNPAVGRRLKLGAMRTMSPSEGLRALEKLLHDGTPQVAVMAIDWPRFHRIYPALSRMSLFEEFRGEDSSCPPAAFPQGERLKLISLLSAPPPERHALLTSYLCDRIARVMELPPSEIDISQPLTGLGMDSLMAIELKNTAEDEFGVSIPIINFLQGDSIAELASFLLSRLGDLDRGLPAQFTKLDRSQPPVGEIDADAQWEDGEV